ncbi:MAG: peroxidase [Acidobacteria bacterium]|nr:peroxidase [Acidobacteriota bacterium]
MASLATSNTPVRDPHVRLSQRPRLPDLPEGRFGRLFPDLPCQETRGDTLLQYGAAGGPLDCDRKEELGEDNPRIPAGWPFFGQFIAHDITHDRSPLQETEEVATLKNFRQPRLDLECIYGAGPVGQPYLYDLHDPDKLLIGPSQSSTGDLPRNGQGLALVGDARNDTHLFISQLHLAFLHFHNRVVDRLRQQGVVRDQVFERAVQMVRWHYQWIVMHEFLPLSVGSDLVEELLASGAKLCRFGKRPFIPVEFSDGAYRFGHAQIRASYDVNQKLRQLPIFPDLVGICPVTAEREVDWTFLFAFAGRQAPQASRRIGPRLVSPLMRLPEALVGQTPRPEFSSLASRDLFRGHAVALPSGEAVARALGLKPVAMPDSGEEKWSETPLWLYVLAESEKEQSGERLGDVGGRIVAEVIFELLRLDPQSFLHNQDWRPDLADEEGRFGIANLLEFAQVV